MTWHAIAGSVGILNDWLGVNQAKIKTIYNMEGKIVHEITPNQIFILVYSDNSTTKIFVNDL